MDIVLNILVVFGLFSVGLSFLVLLPVVGKILVAVFSTVLVERAVARWRGVKSGTVMGAPVVPEPVEDGDVHEPPSVRVYVLVYLSLLVLTVVTVGVSELGLLMREAVFWAVVVASLKAGLVIAWFMHLKGGPPMNRLVLSTSVFFMVIFFTLTMADLSTRTMGGDEEGQWATIDEARDAGSVPSGWSTPTAP